MKCLYFVAPTLSSSHDISDDLHNVGIRDFFLHVIAKDESGLKQQQIHSGNYLETLDVIRDGIIGAALGFAAGLIGVALLNYFQPFGPDVPTLVYVALTGAATLFGAWEGGLVGIGSVNKKLKAFQSEIDAGKYLIVIYVRKELETAVEEMMRGRHPEAALVAVDRFFINPFSAVRRVSPAAAPRA